jgi:MSHA biogenesis protein MshI
MEHRLFSVLRRKPFLAKRVGVVCTRQGCAIATIRRVSGGRPVLESCLSMRGSPTEQEAAIATWFAGNAQQFSAIGGVLDSPDYELLLVESPEVLPAELKAAVRWRLKEAIDFPLEDAVIDVFDIPERRRRSGPKMMYAIAAKRRAIDYQASLLKPAGNRFDVIDIPELALRNLAALQPEAAEGLMFLWLDGDLAQVLVVKERTLYLARRAQCTPSGAADPSVADVDAIALELQRSMDYFESHYEQPPLTHLIIAPHDTRSARLALALAGETSMRIQTLDLSRALDLSPGVEPTDHCSLLAIGAALRADQQKL